MKPGTAEKRAPSNALSQLWRKVQSIEIAMLTTVSDDGTLASRPMATQAVEHEEYLWFFAAKDSGKVKAVKANPAVNLVYANASDGLFVTASGRARVVDNDEKARKYWSKATQAWFPGGPEDSNLVLIEVNVDQAQWWDGNNTRPFSLP